MSDNTKLPDKPLSRLIYKVLGKSRYVNIRNKYKFRSLDSPFPLFHPDPIKVNWENYGEQRALNNSVPLVYVVSPTQRSGTNFLSHIMGHHPDLQFPKGDNLPNEQCLYTYSDELEAYVEKTVTTWGKWIQGGNTQADRHSKGLMQSIGQGILRYFVSFIEPDKTLLFKTPDAGNLKNILHLFPQAKVVILIRDGRDTMESFSKSWGGTGAFEKMCERWAQRAQLILDFKRQADESGLADNYYEVRYDQLNDNTASEMEKIFKFLNMDPEKYPWDELNDMPVLGSSAYKTESGKVHWEPIKKT
ncbi:MAG: sulfotransferase, partial [Bacteroidota bacterium]